MTSLDPLHCPRCRDRIDVPAFDAPVAPNGDRLVRCGSGHEFALIGGSAPDLAVEISQRDTPGQFFMRFEPLVRVYERLWRPLFTQFAGGRDPDAETRLLAEWLAVGDDAVVVDLACGPGNTTRRLAAALAGATVLGLDLSVPMLEQAVRDTPEHARVGFARVDVHHVPIDDASVDGAHCAAALYLLSDPDCAVTEAARILRPGARLVGMTLVPPFEPIGPLGRVSRSLAGSLSGVNYLGPEAVGRLCADAGLVDFTPRRSGGALLFHATKPVSTS